MSHYTTFEERLEIENGLRENLSFGEIAKRLSKDRSTVSREVKKYAVVEKSGYGRCIPRWGRGVVPRSRKLSK